MIQRVLFKPLRPLEATVIILKHKHKHTHKYIPNKGSIMVLLELRSLEQRQPEFEFYFSALLAVQPWTINLKSV